MGPMIRELDDDDLEAVVELFYRHEAEFFPPLSEERYGLADDQDPDAMDDRVVVRANIEVVTDRPDAAVVGAFEDGGLVGALVTALSVELDSMSGEMAPCAWVFLTVVDRDHRQQGIATAMNRYWATEVLPRSDCTWVARRAQAPNTASRRYIKGLGFRAFKRLEEQGHEHIYYRREIDDWIAELADG